MVGRLYRRCLATTSSGNPFQVFDSEAKRHQRNRAAVNDRETSRRTDYLRDEVATRLIERFTVQSDGIMLIQANKSAV
jgi:NADH dehydrogenase [ubiquinone] 1 alpha subcomplex assembly factor 5